MIVQPDFPDHWKTQALIAATGDPAAPMMIIRLWAHCQYRRRWKFKNLSDVALAGICKCTRNANDLKAILLECGWIEESGATITVHDWEQVNSTIIARWRGGETRRRQLLGKLPAKRWSANSLPTSLPSSEKSREEKRRLEKSTDVGKLHFPNGLTDSEWLSRLAQDKTYEGIDVMQEHGKMVNWCKTNQKSPTRRRFINWLNRTERPMQLQAKEKRKESLW